MELTVHFKLHLEDSRDTEKMKDLMVMIGEIQKERPITSVLIDVEVKKLRKIQ